MSGQSNGAARSLKSIAETIANRVADDVRPRTLNDGQSGLVAHKVKKYLKEFGSQRNVMSILWGTQLDLHDVVYGDFFTDSQQWLTIWGVQNSHRLVETRMLFSSENLKSYTRLLAYLVLCAEVWLLLAHWDLIESEDLDSLKHLYDNSHEFEDAA